MRRCACRHGQARACMRAAACARVRCRVRDGVRARRHTADASRASRQSHLTASPVYESSEGGEESAYDDRMSLEHLCATGRAARAHARRASDHSCEPAAAAASSALRRLQSLHILRLKISLSLPTSLFDVALYSAQTLAREQLRSYLRACACEDPY